ncbi:hypothetical protein PDJAM_G00036500 [Pangasius djambal]|uniref:Uncharacterized protein n=1 Tax=Pangasius djambal TaxID=1691987 RepID=A0ACC5YU23_9TELE|nr:hypothetical protein [Pangasius djambal]
MADWSDYRNDDDEVEQEEGEEPAEEYKSSGRDSLVFLVDASKEMFVKGEDGEPSNFDMTMQCVRSVYTSKIISSDRDLVALVFYGTEKSKNPRNSFKHVYVYHDLDSPGARRVQEIDNLRGDKGSQLAAETMGSGETSLGDALWCCSNLYSDIKLRLSHKRLMIFTCRDNPHGGDRTRDKQACTKAEDLKETGVVIDLMHLTKSGGFDVSLFFCDLVSPPEDERELGLQREPCRKLEELQKRVRAREMPKRAQSRMTFSLGDDMNVAVGVYLLARTARKPSAVKLYRDTNEPVLTKTRLFHTQNGSLLLPGNTKRAQVYGSKQIVMEKDEVDEIKKFDNPGSSCVFTALLQRCSERNVFALCKLTSRRNTPPRFVALVPQREVLDSSQVQAAPPGFHAIFLPYADDIRTLDVHECPTASDEQVSKMEEIVHKLRFKYRSDAFENPVLQQHYRNLEALALDMMAPEAIEDFTMPKVKMIDERLGPLVQEFKDLVYPADYNPEGKPSAKRKPAEAGGGVDKKPKAEMSEDELRAHVAKGTLGKLTVPVLKDACKQFGVRTTGTKKQELIDALTAQLAK